ncbi:MAG TPA: YncE family protein [Thermoplasmata archaeon]|nr:YncE family protein [Thermoplasmata archaeon]
MAISIGAVLLAVIVGGTMGFDAGQPSSVTIPFATERTISVGGGPIGVVFDPVNNYLYVTLEENTTLLFNMTVINATTNRVVAWIPMSYGVMTMAVDTRTGYVYTGDAGSTIYAVNPITNRVAWTVPAGCPQGCGPEVQTYDPVSDQIFATDLGNNNLSVVHNATLVTSFSVGSGPNGATYDSTNQDIYVANEGSYSLTIVNGSTDRIVGYVKPVYPGPGVTFDESNGDVYVCSNAIQPGQTNNITAVNGTTNQVVAVIPIKSYCGGAVYDPTNDYLYVTDRGSPSNSSWLSNVTVVDPETNRIVLSLPVGLGPIGINYDSANHNVYVANTYSGTLSVLPQLFRVTFLESGLPPGTNWSVALAGRTFSTNATSISFPEVNGTYDYSIPAVNNSTGSPTSGPVMVEGQSRTIGVEFSNSSSHKSTSTFLGLPVWTGYVLAGGTSAGVLVAIVVAVRRRRKIRPGSSAR